MAQTTIIDIIEDIFRKCGVPCLLAGGFAVNAHGYSRTTFDVDLVIPEEKYSFLAEEFQKEGFKESYRGKVHGRFSGHSEFLTDVDLLFVDSKTFQSLLAEASDKKVGLKNFKVISRDHLIAMKVHDKCTNDLEFFRPAKSLPPPRFSMEEFAMLIEQRLQLFGYPEEARKQDLKELVEVPFRL